MRILELAIRDDIALEVRGHRHRRAGPSGAGSDVRCRVLGRSVCTVPEQVARSMLNRCTVLIHRRVGNRDTGIEPNLVSYEREQQVRGALVDREQQAKRPVINEARNRIGGRSRRPVSSGRGRRETAAPLSRPESRTVSARIGRVGDGYRNRDRLVDGRTLARYLVYSHSIAVGVQRNGAAGSRHVCPGFAGDQLQRQRREIRSTSRSQWDREGDTSRNASKYNLEPGGKIGQTGNIVRSREARIIELGFTLKNGTRCVLRRRRTGTQNRDT